MNLNIIVRNAILVIFQKDYSNYTWIQNMQHIIFNNHLSIQHLPSNMHYKFYHIHLLRIVNLHNLYTSKKFYTYLIDFCIFHIYHKKYTTIYGFYSIFRLYLHSYWDQNLTNQ